MRAVFLPLLLSVLALPACEREKRQFQGQPSTPPQSASSTTEPRAENTLAAKLQASPVEDNAYSVSEGKRLFRRYNCNGCHGSGGGSMGPALMDDKWVYGHEAESIFASIVQGRPNGMPAFGGRIPENQVWQLAAYVRSMSGQLRKDVAPGRGDSMQSREPESARDREVPRRSSDPPPSK
jgi:cytochrome c oxidase cbb3-type subunit III